MPAENAYRGQDPSRSPESSGQGRNGFSASFSGDRPSAVFDPEPWTALSPAFRSALRPAFLVALLATAAAILAPGRVLAQDGLPEGEADDGRLWRVVYVEAGPFRDYAMNLAGLARGLWELGLIEDGDVPIPSDADASVVWRFLSQKAGGDRLAFLADGFYSGGWDDERFQQMCAELVGRLRSGEADLVLAMGTRAGFLVAKGDHEVPTLSITATDPVAAGISKTTERSGLDHVHVQVEAGRIERHLAMFHSVIGFSSLGVPLDSTEAGMAVMGGLAIRQAAKEIGFEIVECRTGLELADFDKSFANLLGCLEILSLESDAVYLPVCNGLIEASASEGRMAELLAPMMSRGLPTFSQGGAAETRLGVLMSMAEEDFLNSGRFEAEVVRDVLAGRRPGDIGQVYLPPLTMALNLDTAEAIGWVPPFEVLAALDEIFTKARATAPDSGPGADAGAGPEALAKTIPQTAHSGGGGR